MLSLKTDRFVPKIYSPASVGEISQLEETAYIQNSELADEVKENKMQENEVLEKEMKKDIMQENEVKKDGVQENEVKKEKLLDASLQTTS